MHWLWSLIQPKASFTENIPLRIHMLLVHITACPLLPTIYKQSQKNFSPTRKRILPTYILRLFLMSLQKEMGLRIKCKTWKAQRLHIILLWNKRHDALTAQPALKHYYTSAIQPVFSPAAQLQSQGVLSPKSIAPGWLLALTSLAPALSQFCASQPLSECQRLISRST